MFDVITVGSATVDCFAILDKDFKNIKHGEKVLLKDIKFMTGGGATNVGVGLSRLGIKTGFLGELGKDDAAKTIKQLLKKEKVSIINKDSSRYPTSYSIILDTKKTDRAILAYKGASNFLHETGFKRKNLKTKWFYFASMVGSSFKTLEHLAFFAIKHNIKVFFNPSSYMAEKGKTYLKKILLSTNILCLNKEEAISLLNNKTKNRTTNKTKNKNNIKYLLTSLMDLSPRMEKVIITDGKHGLHSYDKNNMYFTKPHKIKINDTTGAGDSFGTGFLAGQIMNKDINFCLNLGLVNAESVISKLGAKTGLLKKREAFKEMRNYKIIE